MKKYIGLDKRPIKLLCVMILFTSFVFSDTTVLRGKKVEYLGDAMKYVSLTNKSVPDLLQFTVCIDLNRTVNSTNWTAFTYVSAKEKQELGLVGSGKKLRLYHFDTVYEIEKELPLWAWHTVCCIYDGYSRQLELYVNSTSILNATISSSLKLEGNGSLVLGYNHTNKGNNIQVITSTNFLGCLYFFQMWDYVRLPSDNCSEGNIINWKTEVWKFHHITPTSDPLLRCAGPEEESSTASDENVAQTTPLKSSSGPTSLKPSGTTSTGTSGLIWRTTSVAAILPLSTVTTPTSRHPGAVSTSRTTEDNSKPAPSTTAPIKPSGTTSTGTPGLIWRTTSVAAMLPLSTVTTPTSRHPGAVSTSRTTEDNSKPAPSTTAPTNPIETTRTVGSSPPANLASSPVVSELQTTVFVSTSVAPTAPLHVTFYIIRIIITVLNVNEDESVTERISRLTEAWINNTFKDTEFVVVHFLASEESSDSERTWRGSAQRNHDLQSEINMLSNVNIRSKVLVQAHSSETEDILIAKIEQLLNRTTFTVDPSSIFLQSINVTHLDPGVCPPNRTFSQRIYNWPSTNATMTARLACIDKPNQFATRYCNINIINDRSEWEAPNMEKCKVTYLPECIMGLKDVIVTTEEAEDIAKHILNLTIKAVIPLKMEEMEIILSKTLDIVNIGDMNTDLAQITLEILNAVLTKVQTLQTFTNQILKLLEEVGQRVYFPGEKAILTSKTLALALKDLAEAEFEEMYFCVTSYNQDKNPEIFQEKSPCDEAVAVVFLPSTLQPHVSKNARIQFNFVGQTLLFKDGNQNKMSLNTYVAGASIGNAKILNLKDPVNITLQHLVQKKDNKEPQCVFWDFQMNKNLGGWNSSGCKVAYTDVNYTTCQCDHLTHFGVLMDLSRTDIDALNEYILTIITYVGCGTSSIFLGVAVVIYIAFDQLRRDYPSKILMNLCMALLLLNLVFLVNTWLSSLKNYALCISVAVLLHYFLLASFTWMGLEAVHMYFALVKVFNVYIPKYMLKFFFVGWGVPAIIVVIAVSINQDFYGRKLSSSSDISFCWIREDTVFYISVVGYFCMIFLVNMAMFIVVLLQINSLKSKKEKNQKEGFLHGLKSSASLTVLLGLTWGFAFFAWGPAKVVFLYLFAIFNTLQGFSIFLFHCLMKENVRKQCQIHLCCGRFSLSNYSDWIRMSTIGGSQQKYSTEKVSSQSFLSTKSLQSNKTCSTSNGSNSMEHIPAGSWILPMKHALALPNTRRMTSMETEIQKL